MTAPAVPEQKRDAHAAHVLTALRRAPARAFEAIVALARELLDMPIAAVNLLNADCQMTKVVEGMALDDIPRSDSFCDQTVREDRLTVIPDARRDPRASTLPMVAHASGIRFYAGVPLHAKMPDSEVRSAVGALCVMDREPRELPAHAEEALRRLGLLAEALIETQLATLQAVEAAETAQTQSRLLQRQERVFRQAERLAMIGSFRLDLDTGEVAWSEGVFRIHELPIGEQPHVDKALEHYPPHARAVVTDSLARTIETGTPFDFETDFRTAKGALRRVRSMGELEVQGSVPVAVTGVFQDITEQWQSEQKLRRSASIDEVTRVANRAAFNRELEDEIARVRVSGEPLALVLVDLDHFKEINDSFGHTAGDDVLRAVGRRLRDPMWGDSVAARLGGDEFALIVRDEALCADLADTGQRLRHALARPVVTPDRVIPTSATIGYASYAVCGGYSLREFVHCADSALYEAKRIRRGSVRGYDPGRERRTG